MMRELATLSTDQVPKIGPSALLTTPKHSSFYKDWGIPVLTPPFNSEKKFQKFSKLNKKLSY